MPQTQSKSHIVRNTILVIVLIIIVIVVLILIGNRASVKLYDDPNTVGNTSGNLLNGGLFCESDNKIYFTNPADDDTLYSMDMDLSHLKKIIDDKASYINAAGNYIFYTRRNDKKASTGEGLLSLSATGLFRITKDGKTLGKLYEDPTQVANLSGNYVYYQHYDNDKGLQLFSAKIDGSSNERLSEEGVAPYVIENGMIYFTGLDKDHMIHTMNTNGSGKNVLFDGNCTSLMKAGNHLYYMDMNQNYALARIDLESNESQTLINTRIATYNVDEAESSVYYQVDDGENNGLYRLDLENNETEQLAVGDYNFLHLISNYLFYESYEGDTIYVMNLDTETSEEFKPTVEK